jgi:PAS domain S-box-containing protein
VLLSDLLAEAILSTRSDAIIAADRDGIIHFWNPGAGRLFGYSREEAITVRSISLFLSGCGSVIGTDTAG